MFREYIWWNREQHTIEIRSIDSCCTKKKENLNQCIVCNINIGLSRRKFEIKNRCSSRSFRYAYAAHWDWNWLQSVYFGICGIYFYFTMNGWLLWKLALYSTNIHLVCHVFQFQTLFFPFRINAVQFHLFFFFCSPFFNFYIVSQAITLK